MGGVCKWSAPLNYIFRLLHLHLAELASVIMSKGLFKFLGGDFSPIMRKEQWPSNSVHQLGKKNLKNDFKNEKKGSHTLFITIICACVCGCVESSRISPLKHQDLPEQFICFWNLKRSDEFDQIHSKLYSSNTFYSLRVCLTCCFLLETTQTGVYYQSLKLFSVFFFLPEH